MTTFIRLKISLSATGKLSYFIIFFLLCVWGELSAQALVDESALQAFASDMLHSHVKVLVHKESRPPAPGKPYISAILCRKRNWEDVLLLAEIQDNHFRKLWSSLNKSKSLGGVSPRNLEYVISKNGEYFTFWGCNLHDCGGIDGTYIVNIFDVENKSMQIFDVRKCTPSGAASDPSTVRTVKMCVTNLANENAEISLGVQDVVSKLIRSNIAHSEDVFIDF